MTDRNSISASAEDSLDALDTTSKASDAAGQHRGQIEQPDHAGADVSANEESQRSRVADSGIKPVPSRSLQAATDSGSRISKTEAALKLLRRKNGAALSELQEATGWQPHSVRGFLSGTVKKKLGLNLANESSKHGVRRYRIVTAAQAD